jgi:hypothetical protein
MRRSGEQELATERAQGLVGAQHTVSQAALESPARNAPFRAPTARPILAKYLRWSSQQEQKKLNSDAENYYPCHHNLDKESSKDKW